MVADIDEQGGKKIVETRPESIKFHKTNVTSKSDWQGLLENTLHNFDGLDCLVNNAGTTYKNKVTLWVPYPVTSTS